MFTIYWPFFRALCFFFKTLWYDRNKFEVIVLKKFLILTFLFVILGSIQSVSAGTISWERSERLDDTHFKFYIETYDLEINYLAADMNVVNGNIVSITEQNGWRCKRGDRSIFTHDGIVSGHSTIATVIIELTGTAHYQLGNVKTAAYRCFEDHGYFGPNGNLLTYHDYRNQCFDSNTSLSSITVSAGTLSPSFQQNVRNYTLEVENNISQITFRPTLSSVKSKIISGTTCNLNVGSNTCDIVIEAENGDRGTYRVVVTRKNVTLSGDNTLRSLGVNVGTLNPSFRSDIRNYTMNVNHSVSQILFTPVVNHSAAKIVSGTTCNLSVGNNTCNIVIEAQNGARNTYVVSVTREDAPKSSDATLKNLVANQGTLAPSFQSNVFNYVLNVSDDVDEIVFTATLSNHKGTVSGTTCNLNMGMNTCSLVVTAEDGSTNTYYVIVTRQKEDLEPDEKDYVEVTDLKVSIGTMNPSFQSDIYSYTLKLKEKVEWLDFTYLVHYDSTGDYQHGESYRCKLDASNECNIVVFSFDKTQQKTYQFKVEYDTNSNEELKPGEVENPQTGDGLTTTIIIGMIGISILAGVIFKKKNLLHKV